MSVLARLKSFDVFPKVEEAFQQRTLSGALVSVAGVLFMAVLFLTETSRYLGTDVTPRLVVDTSLGEKLEIHVDVSFAHIPCQLLSLDVMDVSGNHQDDVDANIHKVSLDASGREIGATVKANIGDTLNEADVLDKAAAEPAKAGAPGSGPRPAGAPAAAAAAATKAPQDAPGYCGSCYGAEEHKGSCCNTCESIREAYRIKSWAFDGKGMEQCKGRDDIVVDMDKLKGQGCHVTGFLQVNKVQGNFHFAPGVSFSSGHMHVHDMQAFESGAFDVTHAIEQISFGKPFPGNVNPLDGLKKKAKPGEGAIFQYYIKVVPTRYRYLDGVEIATNQYSITEHRTSVEAKAGRGLPGVFFFYDLSPIAVELEESRRSFLHYLTQLCAIVGGVFTVTGMIDNLVFHSLKAVAVKVDLGKQG